MSEAKQGYELDIFKMVVNKYLDESTSFTERNLNELETKRDQVVWDLTTKIYQQSGHKVELSLVRDIVNSRIRTIKHQLTEEARRTAEQKAQQASEEARRIAEKEKVFVRVRQVISEQLSVKESEVSLDSHLSNYLNADDADLIELVVALEEEFGIEIPDEVAEDSLDIRIHLSFSNSSEGCSNIYTAGEQCVVRNFVELICQKLR